jgi:hypothetical protein
VIGPTPFTCRNNAVCPYFSRPGLSDHVWSLEEIIVMADNYLPKPAKRGPYKKSA